MRPAAVIVLSALTLAAGAVYAQIPPATPEARGAAVFKTMDKNGDGVIDKAEWLAAGRRDQGFDRIDADHDGRITPLELREARAKMAAMRDAKAAATPAPAGAPPAN